VSLSAEAAELAPYVAQIPWDTLREEIDRELCERSLAEFLKQAWPWFDSSPYTHSWHIDAICEHLEAVSRGEIRRLLVNIPPRHSKTNIVAIAWPCWTWARKADPNFPLVGPGTRFLCASYGANKAQQDGVTARRLIGSEWYQRLWGKRVRIQKDRDNQEQYDTSAGGSRISTGIPESLGKGGIIRIIDDPVKTDEVESEKVMDSIIRAYDEVWSTRSNNAMLGAEVIIMQRLGERDLSGHVLERSGWVHLCLPARYEPQRHCSTRLGWEDPRTEDGEPLAPDRFPETAMRRLEREVGPIAWAGQYQQRPEPRGGNIIKRDWWQVWPPEGDEDSWVRPLMDEFGEQAYKDGTPQTYTLFPDFEYVMVSFDGAYTTKEENDWSALTIWGAFTHRGRKGIMLIGAERVRMELHELVTRLKEVCGRRKADMLIIEAKATGISVGQEIRRLMRGPEWQIVLSNPEKDKVARLHSVVPMFSSGMIYAPRRKWADAVIDEVTSFPKGKWDDYCDTVSQGLAWLRKYGIARLQSEADEDDIEDMTFVGNRESVAAGYET
jgi:predicted phage terminase large subunit-like protein